MSTASRSDTPPPPDLLTDALAERIAARLLPQIIELLDRGEGAASADVLIDQSELARRLGCSIPTARRMQLPCVRVGDHARYSWSSVLAELQRRSSSDAGDAGDGGGAR